MVGKDLHKAIGAYINARYRLEAFKALILFVFFSALLWFLVLLTEYLFWLPPQVRRLMFYGTWILQGVLVVVYVLLPWLRYAGFFRKMTPETVAREVAGRIPGVSDKLLNFLQLEQLDTPDRDLLTYELQRREKELLRIDYRRVLPSRRYLQYVYLLFVPLFVATLIKSQRRWHSLVSSYRRLEAYNRVFSPPAPFDVQILSPMRAVPGRLYTLNVGVSGDERPRELHIRLGDVSLPMRRINDSLFRWETTLPDRPLQFGLETGPYRFGPYRIDLMYPPRVEHFSLIARYPAYLYGRKTDTFHRTDLELPEGTLLRWHLKLAHTDSVSLNNRHTFRLTRGKDTLSWQMKLTNDTIVHFRMFNAVTSGSGLYFSLHTVPDLPPRLVLRWKADTSLYRLRHLIFLQGSDDHGLGRLVLVASTPDHKKIRRVIGTFYGRKQLRRSLIFPYDFQLPDSLSYTYHFELTDNNTATGPRRAVSPVLTYRPLIKNKDQRQQREQNILQSTGKNLRQFHRQTNRLNRLVRDLQTQRADNWEMRNKVSDALQKSREQKERLTRLQRRLNELLRRMTQKNPRDPRLKDLQKRMQETEKRLKNDSLERQIQKMLDKLNRDKLLDKLEQLDRQNQLEKRSLDRMLELMKRFYIQEKLSQMSDSLQQLSRQQDSLARTSADKRSDQQRLSRRTDTLFKQFRELQQMNRQLKSPEHIPRLSPEFKTARMFQKQAEQSMPSQPSKANQNQQRAAESMRQMAALLMKMMSRGGEEQHQEDLNMIKALIKDLLDISFTQEELFRLDPANPYVYSKLLEQENRLYQTLQKVSDSLNVIALRQPALSEDLFDDLNRALYHGRKSIDLLQDVQYRMLGLHQRYFYQYVNDLIYLLNLFLDTQSRPNKGSGQGQGKSGQGQSLPDKIRKKSNQIQKGMEQMMRRGKQGKQQGRGDGMSKRAWQLYKQQQQLKELLQQFNGTHPDKRIRELNRKLDELSRQALKQGLNRKLYDQILQIQYELLKLVNATYKQHTSEQRISRKGENTSRPPDSLRLELFRRYFPRYEELQRFDLPLRKEYERLFRKYQREVQ